MTSISHPPQRLLALALTVALLAALTGCAPRAPLPEPPQTEEEHAVAALAEQEYQRAAEHFEAAAETADEAAERGRLRLAAADAWLRAGALESATSALASVDLRALSETEAQRFWIVRAFAMLEHGQPSAARRQLGFLDGAPHGLEVEYYTLRARIAGDENDLLTAARYHDRLADHLEEGAAQKENERQIWALLSEAPRPALDELSAAELERAGRRFTGWVELARLTRAHRLDPPLLAQALARWEERFPEHPAGEHLAPELATRYRERFQPPAQIALLLPLSGDLASAGEAVRDGIFAAYYASNLERPRLKVYDTAAGSQKIAELYQQAVTAGSDYVIGPLTKDELHDLIAEIDTFSVPLLALNTADNTISVPDAITQFGLAPEAEAREAAKHARQRGWEHVIALVPDDRWGDRVGSAFIEAFEAESGTVVHSTRYDPRETDFGGPIRELLNVDSSQQRHRQMVNTLGSAPRFVPRRRQDIDGLFLAAFPEHARLLRPQIDYHHGQDLTVLATSHVYAGRHNPDADRDLDGLWFVDSPWLVDADAGVPEGLRQENLARYWRPLLERHARLMALGIDAYRIVPYLELLREHPEERLDGLTGQLRFDEQRIVRELVSARFRDGRPHFERETEANNGGGAAAGAVSEALGLGELELDELDIGNNDRGNDDHDGAGSTRER
ncbi:hypothetical protein CKO15_02170 [Halorhodospira abdelmalekii]|uniref:penicillin-binding protein activator n=1 Tax=Halorhodospira abdelmalekii TaxID=421629 RepID=UPI00190669FE|nr:penicillin-binding protein activator [Halorhodospira abdelmalekii]MBK1734106.1 hypothetical protein [Halorhodospira abdelmalekii]